MSELQTPELKGQREALSRTVETVWWVLERRYEDRVRDLQSTYGPDLDRAPTE
jgi:hypothetical protein